MTIDTVRVGVLGASGYGGAELVRLLLRHPGVELGALAAGEQSGRSLREVFPHFAEIHDAELEPSDWSKLAARHDVLFAALPHGLALDGVPSALDCDCRVIDLGADYRLRDRAEYRRYYGQEHTDAAGLEAAVYGLPELFRERLRSARLVANPGCYPTAAALALLPVAPSLAGRAVTIDAKSGVSGAGRKAALATSFSEVDGNLRPYGVFTHRHRPEIGQVLGEAGGSGCRVAFTPHLVPMTRGILASAYLDVRGTDLDELAPEALQERYESFYRSEPFVRVLDGSALPQTKATWGSNFCDVAVRLDRESGMLGVFAALDNLVKGAAGQAIQNLNLLFGFDETAGLEGAPVFP